VKNAQVTNWEYMEKIYRYSFDDMKLKPEEHPLLLVDSVFNTERQKMAEVAYEKFKIPSLLIASDAAIVSRYDPTNISISCGHDVVQIVPVYEHLPLRYAATKLDIGVHRMITELGKYFTSTGQLSLPAVTEDAIRKNCILATNYHKEHSTATDVKYELPDETFLNIPAKYVYDLPESLFKPSLVGATCPGIHQAIFELKDKIDEDFQAEIFKRILLYGGSSAYKSFPDRLRAELSEHKLFANSKIMAPPSRKFSIFQNAFEWKFNNEQYLSRQTYDEEGPRVVDRKFLM